MKFRQFIRWAFSDFNEYRQSELQDSKLVEDLKNACRANAELAIQNVDLLGKLHDARSAIRETRSQCAALAIDVITAARKIEIDLARLGAIEDELDEFEEGLSVDENGTAAGADEESPADGSHPGSGGIDHSVLSHPGVEVGSADPSEGDSSSQAAREALPKLRRRGGPFGGCQREGCCSRESCQGDTN